MAKTPQIPAMAGMTPLGWKPATVEYVTRKAPAWAWKLIDETLTLDSQSSAFDPELRAAIAEALEAMIEG